jgi:hypothetical protein
MKPRHSISFLLPFPALILSVLTCATGLQAATITKAATATDLADGASWGGTAPGSSDIAAWVSTSLGASLTLPSSSSWSGISVTGAAGAIGITGKAIFQHS